MTDSSPNGGTAGSGTESQEEDNEEERPPWAKSDRERAILTQSDREYLLGEKEVSQEAERNTRYRIRRRLKNAIRDLVLIEYALPEEDLEQVFDDLGFSEISGPLMLIYKSYQIREGDLEDGGELFDDALRFAIETVERQRNSKRATIKFHVQREEPEADKIIRKITRGSGDLSDILALAESGGLDDLKEAIDKKENVQMKSRGPVDDRTIMQLVSILESMSDGEEYDYEISFEAAKESPEK